MPKYILAYHGSPALTSKEEKAAQMEAWKTWSMQLGEAVIDPGVPLRKSTIITPTDVIDNCGSNPLSGITILRADNLEEAIEMAQKCPHLSGTGTIEIAEAIELEV